MYPYWVILQAAHPAKDLPVAAALESGLGDGEVVVLDDAEEDPQSVPAADAMEGSTTAPEYPDPKEGSKTVHEYPDPKERSKTVPEYPDAAALPSRKRPYDTPADSGPSSYKRRYIRGLERAFEKNEISLATMFTKRDNMVQGISTYMYIKQPPFSTGNLDPDCVSRQVITLLRNSLAANAGTRRCWLAHESVIYYTVDFGDTGFGCGYRNAMMLLSCMQTAGIPAYTAAFSRGIYPAAPPICSISRGNSGYTRAPGLCGARLGAWI